MNRLSTPTPDEAARLAQREAEIQAALLRPLADSIRQVATATVGERCDPEEMSRRVYAVHRSTRPDHDTPRRFPAPQADRTVERARLREVREALEAPVQRLRTAIFSSPTAPFSTWADAVTWIASQADEAVDDGRGRTAVQYVDAKGQTTGVIVPVGSPLDGLRQHCAAWAEGSRLHVFDLQRLVLVGKAPTRLYRLLVERDTPTPHLLVPIGLPLVTRVVRIEIDERDITHAMFREAFKRARETLGLGKRKKATRDESAAELLALVQRLGGPSRATWARVVRELPRFRNHTTDAARKAYTRLMKARGRRR